jgi:hypothetical protein
LFSDLRQGKAEYFNIFCWAICLISKFAVIEVLSKL